MGILFRVHKEPGNQYQERYYQRAVTAALKEEKIPFREQMPVELRFMGKMIGRYFVDFLIDDKVILEIKTTMRFSRSEYEQVLGYLKAFQKSLGILATFRTKELLFKRILNPAEKNSV